MHSTTFFAMALPLTSALAQSSTLVTSVFIPYYGGGQDVGMVASVVGSASSTITYAINCGPAVTDSSECGPPFTQTFGPSYYAAQTTDAPAYSMNIHCNVAGTTAATCTESNGGSEANFPGSSTETYTGTDAGGYQTITVTDGLEKLAGEITGAASASTMGAASSGAASSTTASADSTSASLTKLIGTKTTGSTTGSAPGSATGSATGSAAATKSTGAAGGRTSLSMSAAGVVGVALAAFAL